MTMRLFVFSLFCLFSFRLSAQTDSIESKERIDSLMYLDTTPSEGAVVDKGSLSGYDRRVHYRRKYWGELIPTQVIIQNAGNMGLVSIGIGWDYGKHKQWETNLLLGYLPRYNSRRAKMTMTLKENFIPWSIYVRHGWLFEPLSCGIYFNTVFGSEFWDREPDRYPDKYYPLLKTKVRTNVFVGQRLTKIVPKNRRKFLKSITLFYEISSCDLYIRSAVMERDVSLWDILGLSLGLKLQLL